MKYRTKRLIIWRSLVQAQAGPQTKRLIPNGIQPFLFADHPDINLLFWISRFLAGIIFYTREVLLTSHYEKRLFEHASQPRVACQILDYFLISGVEQTSQEIHISLDEKMNPKLSNDVHFESKGFMEAVNVTDFPIRDHKVILKIRRRRWTDLRTGKSFSIPIDLDIVVKGTRYSKEFGSFLKETYGDIPSDLPYA